MNEPYVRDLIFCLNEYHARDNEFLNMQMCTLYSHYSIVYTIYNFIN